MLIRPDLEEFVRLAAERRVVSVRARLAAADLTPVGVYRSLCGRRELTFLLESAPDGHWSRYSFVGVRAASTLIERDGRAAWLGRPIDGVAEGDPLTVLRQTLDLLASPRDEDLPPFHAGLVGYLGYDLVRGLERLPDSNPDDLAVPEMVMMLASDLAVIDHRLGEVWLIANAINFDGSPERAGAAHADAVRRVRAMAASLTRPMAPSVAETGDPLEPVVRRRRSGEEYRALVAEAVEEIHAGNAFQIVGSQRFEVDFDADPLELYRALRVTNPSPYLYLLRLPGFAVVGASPEALVTVRDGRAVTRPIAGTRPRGADAASDQRLAEELAADPKERAEHVMLVDLGRNDLGRVCVPGSVRVDEIFEVRRYSHVMHLEASVSGSLAPGRDGLDATLACFPAGTVSGAPKVRAMEIIDRLETTRRGVYAGVVGYFDLSGDSDVAIAIRTAVLADGVAHIQAGAGLVADSDPGREDAECRNKARALVAAVARARAVRPLRWAPGAPASGNVEPVPEEPR